MSNNLQVLSDEIYALREHFGAVVCDKDINFDREAGFAMQVLARNDYTVSVAMGNMQSVRDAVTNVAAIGISLNPARKQAYLVPRDKKICLDISYMGLMDLAIASGSIRWGQAEIVYASDVFKRNGFDKPPTHEFEEFSKDRGDIVGVYVVVKTRDGDYLTASMTIEDVYEIRGRSSAWKAYVEKKVKCPWVTDEGEMIKKTVIKRAYKTWPKTERLDQAIHFLNTEGGEGLDLTPQAPDAPTASPELMTDAKAAAKAGSASYAEFWAATGKENRKALAAQHESLKADARRADNPQPNVTDVVDKLTPEQKEFAGALQ